MIGADIALLGHLWRVQCSACAMTLACSRIAFILIGYRFFTTSDFLFQVGILTQSILALAGMIKSQQTNQRLFFFFSLYCIFLEHLIQNRHLINSKEKIASLHMIFF